jgi:hypothetical protein
MQGDWFGYNAKVISLPKTAKQAASFCDIMSACNGIYPSILWHDYIRTDLPGYPDASGRKVETKQTRDMFTRKAGCKFFCIFGAGNQSLGGSGPLRYQWLGV